jgi:hypothetical protein
MRKVLNLGRDFGFATLAVVASMVVLDWVAGVPNGPFTWQAFAQVYDQQCPNGQTDTDGDGIADSNDPDVNEFNPSGCFYNRRTGEILESGSVSVVDAPGAYDVNLDGSNGCFHIVSHQDGEIVFEPTPPPDCVLAGRLGIGPLDCPDKGTFSPTSGSLTPLGNGENPLNPGYLTSAACTDHYFAIDFPDRAADACDPDKIPLRPTAVITNNIALLCPTGRLSTRTIGYWKNHTAEAVQYLPISLGWNSMTGNACRIVATANDVYNTIRGATSKDATTMLRAQLLATKLDVAVGDISGPDLVAVVELIEQADELLGRNKCNPSTSAKGADRAQATYLINQLTLFNQKYGG